MTRPRFRTRMRWRYLGIGALLALGAPLGWAMLSWLTGRIELDLILYVYLTFPTLAAFSAFGYLLGHKQDQLYTLVSQDPLTGLLNQPEFMRVADMLLALAEREQSQMSLVMIDIDNFKQVNDENDHLVGNAVLKRLGQVIAACTRRSDLMGRFGGDEFVLCLPRTTTEDSFHAAERIRRAAEAAQFEFGHASVRITLSLGVSVYDGRSETNVATLLERADHAMYRAKNAGRNRVLFWED